MTGTMWRYLHEVTSGLRPFLSDCPYQNTYYGGTAMFHTGALLADPLSARRAALMEMFDGKSSSKSEKDTFTGKKDHKIQSKRKEGK
jgi:hypothetical protein